jgi:glycosyltransferase involved in cell wall biosynthesis
VKILVNAVSAVAGGGVAYVRNLLEWLPRLAPTDEFWFALAPSLSKRLTDQGHPGPNIHLIEVPAADAGLSARWSFENGELTQWCRQQQPDLLFCLANIIPLRDPGVPIVMLVQNVAPLTPRVRRLTARYEGRGPALRQLALEWLTVRSVRHSAAAICMSEATRTLVGRRAPGIPLHVLYHGTGSRFSPGHPRPEGVPTDPFLLYVSHLYVYKGLEFLIEALSIDRALPRIVIAGKPFDGGYVRSMRELAAREGVLDRLIFLDEVPYEDLPGWYGAAAALVYPSWCENCPNILLEAMACGCPVIAMNTGPMPEICGPAGLYARPRDGGDLARVIRRFLQGQESPHLRQMALERVRAFTWHASIDRHLQVFRSTLGLG